MFFNSTYQGDVCSHTHSFVLDNFIRRIFQDPVEIAGPYIRPGDTVIDFGCGPGYFTAAMAKLTGPGGKVWAVDLQPEMLEKVEKKCRDLGLSAIVNCHRCSQKAIDLDSAVQADFMLAYYMVHEIPDNRVFFKQAYPLLKSGGRFLVVEPPFHVNKSQFKTICTAALEAGFNQLDTPKGKGGRTLLLTRN
jgi:ubiquinone/menaquinone biosynthesis C-methylase UbiE